jgi:hypothetical protein
LEFDNFTHLKSDIEERGIKMDNFFELKKEEESRRGKKCFISVFSTGKFNGIFTIEKYVAVRKIFNNFTLEIFSSNFDFTKVVYERSKNFYLGDNESDSYYLLTFVVSRSVKPEVKQKGVVFFINGTIYLPLPLAYDLCSDEMSKKLIEAISKTNI